MKKLILIMAMLLLSTSFVVAEEAAEMKIADLDLKEVECLTVKYFDLVVGEGAVCSLGTKVECHYTLWFADENGEKVTPHFQSSKDAGKSFVCTLGVRLIKGWSDGMVGMKEGGTRLLVIPPELAYGKGRPGIPANTTLIYEIDFIKLAQ